MSSRNRELAAAIGRLAASCDGAILGLALAAVATASWLKHFATSAALGRIKAAPSASISGLRSIISDGEEEPILVVVRGRVQPTSAIEAHGIWGPFKREGVLTPHGSDESAVAILSTQTCLYNEWKGMLSWSLDLQSILFRTTKEQKSSSLRLVPFILVEDSAWPNSGYVHVNLDGSTQPLPLTTVYHELHPIQATPLTFFQVMLGSGYPVALLNEEKILPIGKEVTAIGICSIRNGAIEIKSSKDLPCFLADMTKDEIVTELNFNARILFWGGVLLGTLSVGILCYAIVRNFWRWKEWRLRRQIEDLEEAIVENSSEGEDVPDGQLCVICLTTQRRSAFIPCGHLVCCPPCAMHVARDRSPKCPVCRQTVRSSIRIYDS
ncbi:E3 ubiquitin-protein ligase SPL2-like [Zingiber officinale]|uniref:E3 ubiquitin-protein ligase SPL2-like n=1 Tax=Zingiber officinale TaxID=94328 RepID=UPI001C4C54DC|nr:E3 ubiquitin-protein ligase SPL2-like [Zingiber officinale]